MTLFRRDQFAEPDAEAGIFIDGLGRALVTWTAMQNRRPVSIAEAAAAFNTEPAIICEAIDSGVMWISWNGPEDDPTKQHIELDGE